jgi:hypothetical protein
VIKHTLLQYSIKIARIVVEFTRIAGIVHGDLVDGLGIDIYDREG